MDMENIKANLTYMFPGVGSEYYGMGRALYNRYEKVKKIYHSAKEVVGIDFYELSFGKNKNKIKENACAHQALMCFCYSLFQVFQEEMHLSPDVMMGYSLGEYSALACAGKMKFKDALYVVNQRAKIIEEVAKDLDGTMVWVINIGWQKVENIVAELREGGEKLYVSAYEANEKVSVSGTNSSMKVLADVIEREQGMVIPVKMSGPFHSPLMKEAEIKLREILKDILFQPGNINVVANYNGEFYRDDRESIVVNLSGQLSNPILWYPSICQSRKGFQNIVVELGPKNVLQYIYKLSFQEDVCFSVESPKKIMEFKGKIEESSNRYRELVKKCMGLVVSFPNHCESEQIYQEQIKAEFEKLKHVYTTMEDGWLNHIQMEKELSRTFGILKAKGVNELEIEKRLKEITEDTMLIGE